MIKVLTLQVLNWGQMIVHRARQLLYLPAKGKKIDVHFPGSTYVLDMGIYISAFLGVGM